jgi:hypothetical protein
VGLKISKLKNKKFTIGVEKMIKFDIHYRMKAKRKPSRE